MRIGIIGTRGIPNKYGGFEQFAMYFAKFLLEEGHEVVVYNSSNHPYKESTWEGVEIVHCYDPENKIGTIGQFVYDFFSILNSRKQKFDVIFQLGYTSSSVWGFLFPKSAKLITNMDGLEWKRTKYSKRVQGFLKKAESWAVKQSDVLIADSIGIQDYLKKKYEAESHYIAYGAEKFSTPNEETLVPFELKKDDYNLVIARLEPENNVEIILKAHSNEHSPTLCVIGDYSNKFGAYLKNEYKRDNILFLGSLYDIDILNNIRYFSRLYFHGHSVGGTNPSLLEAMACNCSIIAHNNEFNKAVLEEDALYFDSSKQIENILINNLTKSNFLVKNERNLSKIETIFSFKSIHSQLNNLIEQP